MPDLVPVSRKQGLDSTPMFNIQLPHCLLLARIHMRGIILEIFGPSTVQAPADVVVHLVSDNIWDFVIGKGVCKSRVVDKSKSDGNARLEMGDVVSPPVLLGVHFAASRGWILEEGVPKLNTIVDAPPQLVPEDWTPTAIDA